MLLQLLDNDADGAADAPEVVSLMASTTRLYMVFVPLTEGEGGQGGGGSGVVWTTAGLFEAYPGSCDVPRWRGASATDRSSWPAARAVGGLRCEHERDATPEALLRLIAQAAAVLYPELWAPSYASAAGAAILASNGDCGFGYLGNWQNPSNSTCSGQYANKDEACNEACTVLEGVSKAVAAYTGGLYTDERALSADDEWLMCTPDKAFAVEPPGVRNAVSLQDGSQALYKLVSDNTLYGHTWLPAVWPDGVYSSTFTCVETCEDYVMCGPDLGRSCSSPSPPPPPPPPYCTSCEHVPAPCSTTCSGCLSPLAPPTTRCEELASECFPACDEYIMCELCPSIPAETRAYCETNCLECEPFVTGVACNSSSLPLSDAFLPSWSTSGSAPLSMCGAYTDAFGVLVCLSAAAKSYCDSQVLPFVVSRVAS